MAASASESAPSPVPDQQLQLLPIDIDFSRRDFPNDFIFGSGTASYQVEGAYVEGGKSFNIWDEMTLNDPSSVTDGTNGYVACDMYHRFKEDVVNMKKLGFDSYRFSFAWSRILPGGRKSMGVNRKAINYYNDVIDTIISNGLQPFATIFHFDLPNCLQNEYGGFLSTKIVRDFREFAEVCFWEFGDRVKFWTTVNEPWTYTVNGYVYGVYPPRETVDTPVSHGPAHRLPRNFDISITPSVTRKISDVKYDKSDPAKDAYTVGRNLLLCHSAAVHLYRTKYQVYQEGKIGIVLNSHYFWPQNEESPDDKAAVNRAIDFMLGWFLEPILHGKYPDSMTNFVPRENLAFFRKSDLDLLKGSIDFLGLNYYTTHYVQNDADLKGQNYLADQKLQTSFTKDNVPIGQPTGAIWVYIVPKGLYQLLNHMKNTYSDLPPIYITENGLPEENNPNLPVAKAVVDPVRIRYHQEHLAYILIAIRNKVVDIKGYFIWAYCDNFEWSDGLTTRFGIVLIDFANDLARYPKDSALWFAKFLKGKKKMIVFASKRQINDERDIDESEIQVKKLKTIEG